MKSLALAKAMVPVLAVMGDGAANPTDVNKLNEIIRDRELARVLPVTEEVLDQALQSYGRQIKLDVLIPAMRYVVSDFSDLEEIRDYRRKLRSKGEALFVDLRETPIVAGECEGEFEIACTHNEPFSPIIVDREKILNYEPRFSTDVITVHKLLASLLHETVHHFMGNTDDRNDYLFTRTMMGLLESGHYEERTYGMEEILHPVQGGFALVNAFYENHVDLHTHKYTARRFCEDRGYAYFYDDDTLTAELNFKQARRLTGSHKPKSAYIMDGEWRSQLFGGREVYIQLHCAGFGK